MWDISICIVGDFCWDPQVKANPEKNNWVPLLCNIIGYYIHALMQIVIFFSQFLELFSLILCAFFGMYWLIQGSGKLIEADAISLPNTHNEAV